MKSQKLYIGYGEIIKLKEVLDLYKSNRIVVVAGKKSFFLSGFQKFLSSVLQNKEVFIYSEIFSNPTISQIVSTGKYFKEKRPDVIIAVGGGSTIDTAKLAKYFMDQPQNIETFLLKKEKNQLILNIPIIAIPLTAGSGAEATPFAVLYHNKYKYSIEDSSILPEVVIIDPQFMKSIPQIVRANSAMDALSQAIESIWNANVTYESIDFANHALDYIIDSFIPFIKYNDENNRLNMAYGSYFSGRAIGITKTTAPHALSYPLTAHYKIPHGQAVGLTLPFFLKYNYEVSESDKVGNRTITDIKNSIDSINKRFEVNNVIDGSLAIKKYMEQVGLATKISALIPNAEEALEKMVNGVNIQRLDNNPRKVEIEKLLFMLREII